MALTDEESRQWRRLMNEADFFADDDLKRFYLRNPRLLAALGNGQLRAHAENAWAPIEPPPEKVKDAMAECLPRKMVADGRVLTRLVDYDVAVDYRRSEFEALQSARMRADRLHDPPPFEDKRDADIARRRHGGVMVRKLRLVVVMGESSLLSLGGVIRLYGFVPVDPRTVAAFVESHPRSIDHELVVTQALFHNWHPHAPTIRPSLYYVESRRDMLGMTIRRFQCSTPAFDEDEPHARHALVVEVPTP